MYAMGWTQHTTGTQNIRTMAIIQLLLGNMGVAGGGVNALRGESNVQGSTDHCLLWHIWPGYLKTHGHPTLPGGLQSKMDTSQQGSPVRQLVAELPQIQRIHAQILFRRTGQCGQRVRLSMAAQGG
jgi:anaerobic selenocysteine-containing dehydrogenase